MNTADGQGGVRTNRRQLQAAQTRRDIIVAATRLFTRQGYAHTSVTDIAREAGVAVQTIYSSVGSKARLVTAMLDEVDTIAGIPQLTAEVMRSTDAGHVIDLQTRLTRQLNERCQEILAGLRSAAQVDQTIAAAYADGHARHIAGARRGAERLAELGALRPGTDVDTAAVALSVLLWIDTWAQLVTGHGWTFDHAEAWLSASLRTLLLAE
ncbi:TetR/AcrR family transcriptional regulator [Dactylosporangium sp. AC04546]|uniref:TetR/AcrR family transcriptional regulator n=1 Tax=Dactylosporangium sp. AC04546 TaxID=2862460 RepID=UPI001EDDA1E6|nr:TetR/AcrR family transcriptional regulator [Dactylosporangium sp. AC04546]WVK83092.1 TetR/AcrR family transcriptional regulator [Dactylosporangium sp. AC04546]